MIMKKLIKICIIIIESSLFLTLCAKREEGRGKNMGRNLMPDYLFTLENTNINKLF